ncbi:MAG TPA: penicillin acylase family protein [Gemmatimonadales bacterium]|nr:penicillin acylase family protein [Gemmatimonadales bacterium]
MHVLPLVLSAAVATAQLPTHGARDADVARWEREARAVTITRDDWGIPHVHGTTDADAVFGMIYAQAEDDFNRVETNYINAMGRLAEAEGESAVWQDLRMKLFVDPDSMRAKYAASPAWLRRLMNAWADGLNFYLHTHPAVKPRVISRFEPWMALTFSEGSIGGDIESISLDGLRAFYGDSAGRPRPAEASEHAKEPSGSNGFAIAPANTVDGRALLLINPHTSFFFRAELQMTSDEGLDAYGAVTWGQFFVYQGFNDRAGWMHTSTGADAIDEYAETIVRKDGRLYYRYGGEERPLVTGRVTVPCRTAGGVANRTFTVYRTHHGPIVRAADGRWISVRLMERPVEALSQSFLRTRARTLAAYRKVMELHANSSNNTVYADADGHIAYFHPQFVPRRDDRFDWTRPVDGSDPATEWHGVHGVEDSPHVVDPANGWIQNTNDWPYSAAGANSPRRESFPAYMDNAGESPRGLHAIRVLEGRKDFTPERLRDAAFDSYLTAFARLVPPLLAAYDAAAVRDSLEAKLAGPIAALRAWDYRWSAGSVPTSLAVYWGDTLATLVRGAASAAGVPVYDYMVTRATAEQRLAALAAAAGRLTRDFGTWRTPWGEINRFQRLTGDIVQRFDDAGPSIPVPFTSSRWGSLASFGARTYPGTKRMYGTSGNSFVAVVEFGKDSVRAMAVTAGGESGDPRSRHFNDQAERYAAGTLREVYFYPRQLDGHTERAYHPGG